MADEKKLAVVLEFDDSQVKKGAAGTQNALAGMSGAFFKANLAVEALSRAFDFTVNVANEVIGALKQVASAALNYVVAATQTAARTEVLGTVVEVVGKAAGVAAEELAKQEKAVKDLGVTTQGARTILVRLMQSQLDVTEATRLARAAQDLAVISGEDSTATALNLMEAITAQSVIMLRQYGIVTTLEQLYAEYGEELGIATKKVNRAGNVTAQWSRELTTAEKKQAFLNAIMSQATRVAGSYEAAMEDAGKKVTSLVRVKEEFANAIGNIFLPIFGAYVDAQYEAYPKLTELVTKYSDTAREKIQEFVNRATEYWQSFQKGFMEYWEMYGARTFEILIQQLKATFKNLQDLVTSENANKFFQQLGSDTASKALDIMQGLVRAFIRFVELVTSDQFQKDFNFLVDRMRDWVEHIEKVAKAVGMIYEGFRKISGTAWGEKVGEWLYKETMGKQHGGYIPATGPYLLHKGERVVPKTGVDRTMNLTPTVNFYGDLSVRSQADIDEIANKVSRVLGRQAEIERWHG